MTQKLKKSEELPCDSSQKFVTKVCPLRTKLDKFASVKASFPPPSHASACIIKKVVPT